MNKIAVQELLEVLGAFDELGGASPGLVAWELFADEAAVTAAWEHALAEGWLRPCLMVRPGRGQSQDRREPRQRLLSRGETSFCAVPGSARRLVARASV